MFFNERFPFIDNWFFLGFLLQVLFLGMVHYRIEGSWFTVFTNSVKPAILRARQSLDNLSMALLLFNAAMSLAFLIAKFLIVDFYLLTSMVSALLIALLFLCFWHLDYLFLWFFLQQSPSKSVYEGNVWLGLLGIFFVAFNFIQFFLAPDSTVLLCLLALMFAVFCLRLRALVFGAKITGFLWYYFILYLCTVYVVPSILISKYYNAHWLDFLTP